MALYATHIRFAKDLLEFLEVKDFLDYYSGTTYPDSRNFTKVAREKTHGAKTPNNPFAPGLSDFERGWAAHNLYDELSVDYYKKNSPWPDEDIEIIGRLWFFVTAEKVVEELFSLAILGEDSLWLTKVRSPEKTPGGEELKTLQGFYTLISQTYSQPLDLKDFRKLFLNFGASPEFADNIMVFAEQINNDQALVKEIAGFYEKILFLVVKNKHI